MRGRIIDFSVGFNRKQRITLEVDGDFRHQYDALKDKDVEVRISQWKDKRSLNANAYFHALVNEIARVCKATDTEIKRNLVLEYGVVARDINGQIVGFKLPPSVEVDDIYPYTRLHSQVVENGKTFNCYLLYKRTADLNTAEFSRLLEGAIQEAKELGIETDDAYLKSLKESKP